MQHGGRAPETREEKAQFKEQLRNEQQDSKEDNFEEALNAAYKAWTPTTVREPNVLTLDNFVLKGYLCHRCRRQYARYWMTLSV